METSISPYKYSPFTRGVLGGLFVGIGATVINIAFELIYRSITAYQFSEFISINSIIFFTIPTLVAAGIVYSIFMEYVKRGLLMYTILAVVLTVIVAFIPLGENMLPSGEPMPQSARGLTLGIELITGIIGAFALPYFAEHPKIWSDSD
jgi:hypothetical protein